MISALRLKLICCDVFARLAYAVAAKSPHIVDIELLPMLAHNEPDKLRRDLQQAIDKSGPLGYNRIILAYGLCGNATANLSSQIPMIIPRMHDCSAMFLGSQEKFLQVFGSRLSAPWSSRGYLERCLQDDYKKLTDEYGEENAKYIWETMNPPAEVYIKLEGFEYKTVSQDDDNPDWEVVEGDTGWFKRLINGPWDNKDFLEILPGTEIEPIYDMKEIFRSKKYL